MADSRQYHTGDGVTDTYTLALPYLERNHIDARVGDASVPFTWLSSTQIQLDSVPANNAYIEFRRTTPSGYVQWTNSSIMTDDMLEKVRLYNVYRTEEAYDEADVALEDRLSSVVVYAKTLDGGGGTHSTNANAHPCIEYAEGVSRTSSFFTGPHHQWANGKILGVRVYFTHETFTPSAGVRWQVFLASTAIGQDTNTGVIGEAVTASVPAGTAVLGVAEILLPSPITHTSGNFISGLVGRDGTHVDDTLTGVAELLAFELIFQEDPS